MNPLMPAEQHRWIHPHSHRQHSVAFDGRLQAFSLERGRVCGVDTHPLSDFFYGHLSCSETCREIPIQERAGVLSSLEPIGTPNFPHFFRLMQTPLFQKNRFSSSTIQSFFRVLPFESAMFYDFLFGVVIPFFKV